MSETHVEILLDPVAASSDLMPDTFGVAFVESLDQVCTVYQIRNMDVSLQIQGPVRDVHKLTLQLALAHQMLSQDQRREGGGHISQAAYTYDVSVV